MFGGRVVTGNFIWPATEDDCGSGDSDADADAVSLGASAKGRSFDGQLIEGQRIAGHWIWGKLIEVQLIEGKEVGSCGSRIVVKFCSIWIGFKEGQLDADDPSLKTIVGCKTRISSVSGVKITDWVEHPTNANSNSYTKRNTNRITIVSKTINCKFQKINAKFQYLFENNH